MYVEASEGDTHEMRTPTDTTLGRMFQELANPAFKNHPIVFTLFIDLFVDQAHHVLMIGVGFQITDTP